MPKHIQLAAAEKEFRDCVDGKKRGGIRPNVKAFQAAGLNPRNVGALSLEPCHRTCKYQCKEVTKNAAAVMEYR